MRVCGIICEYNPFHKGHSRHILAAKDRSGADYIVCSMSGPVTQRGEFARHDKWTRARAALDAGADLVLELPVRFASGAAQDFARGGVMTLCGLGVLTHLSFGCEPDAMDALLPAARALKTESPAMQAAVREGLSAGLPYPAALARAAQSVCDIPNLSAVLALPNASLALAYLRELPDGVTPVPVARVGGGYHDETLTELSSATAVRAALERGALSDALAALPFPDGFAEAEARGFVHRPGALSQSLLYILRTARPDALREICGMDEGIENRLIEAAQTAHDRQSLIEAAKTKRYTWARISRLCAHALLGLTRDTAYAYVNPAYARILGFKKSAAPLLHEIKKSASLPIITKAADFDRSHPLFALDVRAQDLWSLGCASPDFRTSGLDFTHGPVIL